MHLPQNERRVQNHQQEAMQYNGLKDKSSMQPYPNCILPKQQEKYLEQVEVK